MNLSKSKKKIAIVHPEIRGGGGEAILAWILEALKGEYCLTVISINNANASFFNNFYGTHLSQDDFSVSQVYPILTQFPQHLYLFKRHLIMRYCKAVKKQYDLFFSTQNELDFGIKGLQYIHFPVHANKLMSGELNQLPNSWFYRNLFPRNFYKYVCVRLSHFSEDGIKQNFTLVNSNWTGNHVKDIYDIQSTTVYPPVLFDGPFLPWGERENGFVCVGRIIPQKNIDKIINILSEVRKRGFDIHLHIIGPIWDKTYTAKILHLCERNQEWLFFEGMLSKSELANFIKRHKFAIHGMKDEHFGIAVAEMAKAGNIVFVPDGGGQREIVDFDYSVIYLNEKDAVEKILRILNDLYIQEAFSQQMMMLGSRFSSEHFMNQTKSFVKNILQG